MKDTIIKRDNYFIIKTEKPYAALIVGITYECPYIYWHKLENDLIKNNITGKVLIDCLLYSGNNCSRFIEVDFDNTFNDNSIKNVILDRSDSYRILSSEILSEYPEIVDYSILNNCQIKLILNNVTL
jgi:hypothetical protein